MEKKEAVIALEMLTELRDAFRRGKEITLSEHLHARPALFTSIRDRVARNAREDIRRALAGEGMGEREMSTVTPEAYERMKAQIREQRQASMDAGEQARPDTYQISEEDDIGYMPVPCDQRGYADADIHQGAFNRAIRDMMDNARLAAFPKYAGWDRADGDIAVVASVSRMPGYIMVMVDDIRLVEVEEKKLRGAQSGQARERQLAISRGEKHGPPRSKYARKRW